MSRALVATRRHKGQDTGAHRKENGVAQGTLDQGDEREKVKVKESDGLFGASIPAKRGLGSHPWSALL